MVLFRRVISSILLAFGVNLLSLLFLTDARFGVSLPRSIKFGVFLILFVCFAVINIKPQRRREMPNKSVGVLYSGCELLRLFLISATLTAVFQIVTAVCAYFLIFPWKTAVSGAMLGRWSAGLLLAFLGEAFVFWNGMIRVYLTSVQLGIKHRIAAAVCGWIPGLNIYYLKKIIDIAAAEIETETQKWELNAVRAENEICGTKYPILLVHGVFFRDFRYLNYWGRIPRELAERIRGIAEETGCEKVNIIAHSKGGLDSRAAIAHHGAAPYVATLTTINTPHRGCIFAEYLLNKVPEKARNAISETYNATLRKLGDHSPDFLAAVTDLTESACLARNEVTPDASDVLYESVMSYCGKARSGKFPLNVSYPLVRHFDGKNDGLVSVTSAKWGSRFTLLEPAGKRGISHGDVIDLNRENIKGFDVREFYVSLAADLKRRGY